jgi:hypothetical protein
MRPENLLRGKDTPFIIQLLKTLMCKGPNKDNR